MQITTTFADTFINEMSITYVEVTFSNERFNGYPEFNPMTGKLEIVEVPTKMLTTNEGDQLEIVGAEYTPFELAINNSYKHIENDIFKNHKYTFFINELTDQVLREIDTNINLRLGKWDIIDYFTELKLKLDEIRSSFHEISHLELETHYKKLYYNRRAKIKANFQELMNVPGIRDWVHWVLTYYWHDQMNSIDRIIDYINRRESIIEKYNDYVKFINDFPKTQGVFTWEASDTDLLELIVALVESGSLQNSTKSILRKEVIEFFSEIFGLEIKDAESKLSRATDRKKDLSPFLTKLKLNFEKYVQKKDELK